MNVFIIARRRKKWHSTRFYTVVLAVVLLTVIFQIRHLHKLVSQTEVRHTKWMKRCGC